MLLIVIQFQTLCFVIFYRTLEVLAIIITRGLLLLPLKGMQYIIVTITIDFKVSLAIQARPFDKKWERSGEPPTA